MTTSIRRFLLLLLAPSFFFFCSYAIRPSLTPGAKVARKIFQKRPKFLHYRTVADEDPENIASGKRIRSLDQLQFVDTAKRRELLAQELSFLMKGIEKLAVEVEETKSIPPLRTSEPKTKAKSSKNHLVKNAHELRRAVLDEGRELKEIQLDQEAQLLVNASVEQLLNHDVVELMAHRFKMGSTPGNRAPHDTAKLALSIEGGGMRGAVSAGMASAIACLGLCDCFDSIYGSSAGSVIGAYMVSRQMCMDVYVDILPAAKRSFVCTKRIMSALAVTAVDMFLSGVRRMNPSATLQDELNLPKSRFGLRATPGMNISFVLDGIMDPDHGIRPIDMESFKRNDQKQPLKIASSCVKDGRLYTKCFGTKDFFGDHSTMREDGKRKGLFACLEPSMTVPGATGPPVRLYTHEHGNQTSVPFFDAFCFEPLPYRSAVDDGATHVLVLCSRPEGFEPKVKPGVYENAIAPLYFKSHEEPEVAEFFSRGGQQYIYLEDMLTLEEGKVAGMNKEGPIAVPPAKILYGVDQNNDTHSYAAQRDDEWKTAHLLPLKVPYGTPELATLEQGKEAVREAVQGGFAAAFDLLAPAIGLNTHGDLTGMEVAKLVFPEHAGPLDEVILQEQKRILGDAIESATHNVEEQPETPSGLRREKRRRRDAFVNNARDVLHGLARSKRRRDVLLDDTDDKQTARPVNGNVVINGISQQPPIALSVGNDKHNAKQLLNSLPGLKFGRLAQLAVGLKDVAESKKDETLSP